MSKTDVPATLAQQLLAEAKSNGGHTREFVFHDAGSSIVGEVTHIGARRKGAKEHRELTVRILEHTGELHDRGTTALPTHVFADTHARVLLNHRHLRDMEAEVGDTIVIACTAKGPRDAFYRHTVVSHADNGSTHADNGVAAEERDPWTQ